MPSFLKQQFGWRCWERKERLGRDELIGKVHLTSIMLVEDVKNEIRSIFTSVLGSGSFTYLQATGGSMRCLTVPSVSTSFWWTTQQVAKLGNQQNTIYILADGDLNPPCSFDEICLNLYTHDKASCTTTFVAYIVCIHVGYVRWGANCCYASVRMHRRHTVVGLCVYVYLYVCNSRFLETATH